MFCACIDSLSLLVSCLPENGSGLSNLWFGLGFLLLVVVVFANLA